MMNRCSCNKFNFVKFLKPIVTTVWVIILSSASFAYSTKHEVVVDSDDYGNNVCFINNNNKENHDDDVITDKKLKRLCCVAFCKRFSNRYKSADLESSYLFSSKFCMKQISNIPNVSLDGKHLSSSSSLYPVYYWNSLSTSSHHDAPITIIEESVDTASSIDQNEIKSYSPFNYPHSFSESADTLAQQDPMLYQIKHNTFLSQDGGMHRAFVNTVSISFDDQILLTGIHQHDDAESIHIKGSLIFLFPILEGYFIDLDDPFQDDLDHACHIQLVKLAINEVGDNEKDDEEKSLHCQVEIITSPEDLVIDIEQPSFASKQHVIAFQIDFHVKMKNTMNTKERIGKMIDPISSLIEIKFVPVIHIRYQWPILLTEKNNVSIGYVHIPISNVFMHDATIESKVGYSNGYNSDPNYFKLNMERQLRDSTHAMNIIIEVSSGLDKHYNFIMTFTMLACIIGAIQMIRDFSKVGKWN